MSHALVEAHASLEALEWFSVWVESREEAKRFAALIRLVERHIRRLS